MAVRNALSGMTKKRLRRWLAVFFLALAIPTIILIIQAYSQLKWEAFHQNRLLAEELTARIDSHLIEFIHQQESHSFSDYSFLVAAGEPAANLVQRSPLSTYPVDNSIAGLIGYFQVDAEGKFSTPLLPVEWVKAPPKEFAEHNAYGISPQQANQRLALQHEIRQILGENRLVHTVKNKETSVVPAATQNLTRPQTAGNDASTSEMSEVQRNAAAPVAQEQPVPSQAAFDQLKDLSKDKEAQAKQPISNKLGRVEDLKLEKRFQAEPSKSKRQIASKVAPLLEKRVMRKERSALPEPLADANLQPQTRAPLRVRTFESEIDPFEFSLLGSGHFVLFRKVWRDGQRYIQGALIEQQPFLRGMIETAFREASIAQASNLIVAYQGNVITAFNGLSDRSYYSSASELTGQLLYQSRLSAPLSDIELIFSITQLPAGPGGTVVSWVAGTLLLVLFGGFFLMYRLGLRQIELTRQQQDFVSAVSHELKTPLTSIRMYGEMLRAGWASDEKKGEYYNYIYNESERLSRLINNVLQLARMTRNELPVNLKPATAGELMDVIKSKVHTQIEQAGFKPLLNCNAEAAEAGLKVDQDFFTQIIINLVDNAIKFSGKADTKTIEILCMNEGDKAVFSVRDYGPGISKGQMKKIFQLFYRTESELTRETVGTGIGLALVRELAIAMDATVDVVNRDPGAEFRLCLPAVFKDDLST